MNVLLPSFPRDGLRMYLNRSEFRNGILSRVEWSGVECGIADDHHGLPPSFLPSFLPISSFVPPFVHSATSVESIVVPPSLAPFATLVTTVVRPSVRPSGRGGGGRRVGRPALLRFVSQIKDGFNA